MQVDDDDDDDAGANCQVKERDPVAMHVMCS
jgi:hypothetical protein